MKILNVDLNLKVLLTENMIMIIVILNKHFKSPFALER